jgi:hypothetical protein
MAGEVHMTLYRGRFIGVVLLAALFATLAGCSLVGVIGQAIPVTIDAEYTGLKGQKIAVMCWVDQGIRTDYPQLQLDTATFVQKDLTDQKDSSELKESQWPWEARSVIRFQREHPELEGRPINEYAHRLSGVTRLIYIEVDQFSTRGDETVQLKRGRMLGRVKVLEIADGKSKIAYEKQNIEVTFPPNRPEGVLDVADPQVYSETVKLFGTEIGQLFYSRQVERE